MNQAVPTQPWYTTAKRPLVNHLGFQTNAPGFGQALLKLTLRRGDTAVQGQVISGCLSCSSAEFLDLAD